MTALKLKYLISNTTRIEFVSMKINGKLTAMNNSQTGSNFELLRTQGGVEFETRSNVNDDSDCFVCSLISLCKFVITKHTKLPAELILFQRAP